jgi:tRNA modification GTPase
VSDTIAAIATAQMPAGIGVLRISGSRAFETAQEIFTAKSGKTVTQMAAYNATLGKVHDKVSDIDQCIALVFHAPHSYTGEDVVELSCHGGSYILRRVLDAAIEAGARLALPGEFTKRAFLNGKMDLTEAEAVMDLIGAQSEAAARLALSQHQGALFKNIEKLKTELLEISADITAWIDFPDEGVPSLEPEALNKSLENVANNINMLVSNFEQGRILREGVETAIVGKPNVGKSTLMNVIAGSEKSIVTHVPGTTRDIIEENVNFAGIVLRLFDTAGIHETIDPVESIGVSRARKRLETAQLVFAVFDASSPLDEEDINIISQLKNRNAVAIINKCDLPIKVDETYISNKISQIVYISAAKGDGISKLEEITRKLADTSNIDPNAGIVANQRQLECLLRAGDGVAAALEAVKTGLTLDAVSVGVEEAIGVLCELTGERASEEIIERVFSKFCIGK